MFLDKKVSSSIIVRNFGGTKAFCIGLFAGLVGSIFRWIYIAQNSGFCPIFDCLIFKMV